MQKLRTIPKSPSNILSSLCNISVFLHKLVKMPPKHQTLDFEHINFTEQIQNKVILKNSSDFTEYEARYCSKVCSLKSSLWEKVQIYQ